MSIRDYITKEISILGLEYSTADIDNFMALNNINADANLTEIRRSVDIAIVNLIPALLLRPNSVSEGGYSVSWNKDNLLSYYNLRCTQLGIVNKLATNTVKEVKIW